MASTWLKIREKPFFYAVAALLVGLAIHAPFITLSNHLLDTFDGVGPPEWYLEADVLGLFLRMWKELLLGVLVLFSIKPFFKKKLYQNRIVQAVLAYIAWTLLYAGIFWNGLPTIAGLRYNLGMFVVFLVVVSLGRKQWQKPLEKLILWLGGIVAASALLQLILPPELFAFDIINVGENVGTIQDSDIRRMHGFMPGPLQLGSYLILPLALGFQRALKKFQREWLLYSGLLVFAIYLSYSRAALLAAGMVVFLLPFLKYRQHFTLRRLVYGGLALYSLGVVTIMLAFTWEPLSLLVFHAEPERAFFESSTVSHFKGAGESLQKIAAQPLGYGLGVTGPASNFGQIGSSSESNILQIAEEVGLIGVTLFFVVLLGIANNLKSKKPALIAALAGLMLMSLVLHTLTDTATMWSMMALGALCVREKKRQLI